MKEIIQAVFSSPYDSNSPSKVTIKPLLIKQKLVYQITEQKEKQALHRNVDHFDPQEWLKIYKQGTVFTADADYHLIGSKTLKRPPTLKPKLPMHNRKKNYILEEGAPIPFLVELGVMDKHGKVLSKKFDKFRQINRFLEMIRDILPDLGEQLHIIDFGCGKAYLTFALYYYLHEMLGKKIKVTGLDLKKDVVEFCQKTADTLHYENLKFLVGDIAHHEAHETVDMVISLHACDTATDAALVKAVQWKAKAILSVPCCQHELFDKLECPSLKPLLKFGILKERFAALATDAFRGNWLESQGYQTQILEFIDLEHTPKNLLIRAIRKGKASGTQDLEQLKQFLGTAPSLLK